MSAALAQESPFETGAHLPLVTAGALLAIAAATVAALAPGLVVIPTAVSFAAYLALRTGLREGPIAWLRAAADAAVVAILLALSLPEAAAIAPGGGLGSLILLSPAGSITAVFAFALAMLMSAAIGGRGLDHYERLGVLAMTAVVAGVLALGSEEASNSVMVRIVILFAIGELLTGMIGLILRRHWPAAPLLHALLFLSALLAATGRPIADIPSLLTGYPPISTIAIAVTAAGLAQAGLWCFVYLMTGLLLDGLTGRPPTARAVLGHARNGLAKGAIFGAVFMAIVITGAHVLNAELSHPPMILAAGLGAVLFPLARTILESSDESTPFFGRLLDAYRDWRGYVRGIVVGVGLAMLMAKGLPSEDSWPRFSQTFVLGALALGGVDLVADVAAILTGRRRRLQTPALYVLGACFGGIVAGALGWYFDQSQLNIVMAKIQSYGNLQHTDNARYTFQVFFNKWGTVDLGPVTGGVRLFYDESLSGVINWSIAAPLFSLNMVALEALFRRSLAPVRALVRPEGLRGVVEQTVRVLRWGLWMAPIIFSFLRMSPDPAWYNQDGLVRTVVATGAHLTLPPETFRAWSLSVFTGLLAYDWLRVLIWFDHMGLRVATLVNLSFVGGDRLDEWTGRMIGHTAKTRAIPPAIRRFMTWAPLIIPFYIPRGAEWDKAWNEAEALGKTAAPLSEQVAFMATAYTVAALLIAAGLVWLAVALRRGRALRREEQHVLSNGLYELVVTPDGRSHARVTGIERSGAPIDLTRPADDPMDRDGKVLFLVDLDRPSSPAVLVGRVQDGARLTWPETQRPTIVHALDGVTVEIAIALADEEAVETRRVTLTNTSGRRRRLRLVSAEVIVMNETGAWHRDGAFNALHIETLFCSHHRAIFARNRLLSRREERTSSEVMFHAVSPGHGTRLTGYQDSAEAFADNLKGLPFRPLEDEGWLDTFNPMAALVLDVDMAPGEKATALYADGHADTLDAAAGLLARHLSASPDPCGAAERRRAILCHAPCAERRFRFDGAGHLHAEGDHWRPWAHVMANPLGYGVVADMSGMVTSFAQNARQNALTPFRFQGFPSAVPGTGVALYDLDRREATSVLPVGGNQRVSFAPGSARIEGASGGFAYLTEVTVLPEAQGEVRRIRVTNGAGAPRRVRVLVWSAMVLAEFPAESAGTLEVERDPATGALLFVNPSNVYANGTAIVATDLDGAQVETVYAAVVGGAPLGQPHLLVNGLVDPDATDDGRRIAAFHREVTIAAGGAFEVRLAMGYAADRASALQFVKEALPKGAARAPALAHRWWQDYLSGVEVETDDPAFDRLVNLWLPYQVLAARLWGRTGASQRGGAMGFRDQLQDVEPMTLIDPGLARRQIVLHAGQQFLEGDVLKWWHQDENGVTLFGQRTKASDPHLWLPFVAISYIDRTGDAGVLDEDVAYLEGQPIPPGEDALFFSPRPSRETGTVREHCLRAIDLALSRRGPRGLPLLGSGDWDDGYDAAGLKGVGESVWMAMFLHRILEGAGRVLSPARKDGFERAMAALREAIEGTWTGSYFARAFADDGRPFGGVHALPASWAAISGAVPFERARAAAEFGFSTLAAPELVRLLTPAFNAASDPWPGRVARYPEGVRENGGQYSHGASWFVDGFATLARRAERPEEQARLMRLAADAWWTISPLARLTPEALALMGLPPHQQPADVYAGEGYFARGGWAWYTGSAGRMLTAAHAMLGIEMEGGVIRRADVPANGRYALKHLRVRSR
ncbi:MAG: glycosyl transferase family 36 [Hyphomicrobiales bacterium]